MSDIILASPNVIDSIEFYVSYEPLFRGLSVSGLSRLCGIDRTTISPMLNSLDRGDGKNAPNALKPLQGNVFIPMAIGIDGARIVNSKTASRIIRYYAYESKVANDIAKVAYDKFAEIGMDNWIDNITGNKLEKNNEPTNTLIFEKLQELLIEVKETKEITIEYKKLINATHIIVPGIDRMLDEFKEMNIEQIALPSGNKISLNEWVRQHKNQSLSGNAIHKLAHLVSGVYKTATGKEPERATIIKGIDKKTGRKKYQANTCVYSENEFPLLEAAWNKLMCS